MYLSSDSAENNVISIITLFISFVSIIMVIINSEYINDLYTASIIILINVILTSISNFLLYRLRECCRDHSVICIFIEFIKYGLTIVLLIASIYNINMSIILYIIDTILMIEVILRIFAVYPELSLKFKLILSYSYIVLRACYVLGMFIVFYAFIAWLIYKDIDPVSFGSIRLSIITLIYLQDSYDGKYITNLDNAHPGSFVFLTLYVATARVISLGLLAQAISSLWITIQ